MTWYEDLNKKYQSMAPISNGVPRFNTLDEYKAYQEIVKAEQRKAQQPKKKGWVLDQLSTGGGIGGSLAGAAIGTSILPGVGTILGGILGGAGGSAVGEVGENLISGEKDLGKNVGREALMGGIAGVPIFRGAKGLKAAGQVLASGGGRTAANTALAQALTKTSGKVATSNVLARAGKSVTADTLGVRTGAKIAGKGILKPQYIDDLTNLVTKQAGQAGRVPNAAKVLQTTQNYVDDVGKAISKKITGSKVIINGADVSGDIVKNLQKELIDIDNPLAKSVLERLKTAKSPADLWGLRKIVDSKISWIANPDAATSATNSLANSIRNTLNKYINKAGVAGLNKEYQLASDAIKLMQPSALNPKGLNVLGMRVGGSIVQRGKLGAGNLMAGGGAGLGGMLGEAMGRIPQGLMGATARQFGGRAITGASQGYPEEQEEPIDMSAMSSFGGYGTQGMQGMPQTSPYSREALIHDMQRDPRNANKYLAYFQQLQEVYSPQATQEYNSTISERLSDFSSSLNELNRLSEAISSGAGTTSPIMGRIRSANPYDIDQQTLQAMIDKTRQIVGKALEGGVLRKEDEEKYKKILPTTVDSKATALNKIAMIQTQLNEKMRIYQSLVGAGGGQMSQEDAFMQNQMYNSY